MYYYSLFCLSNNDPSPGFVFIHTGVQTENPISEPSLDLAVILVTSHYEDNTLPVNSEQ